MLCHIKRYARSALLWYFTKRRTVDSSWNVMAHGDARERKWRGNWRMEWGSQYTSHYPGTWCILHYYSWWRTPRLPAVDCTDVPPADLNGLVRFARKTKSGFCACAIIFQTVYFFNFPNFFFRATLNRGYIILGYKGPPVYGTAHYCTILISQVLYFHVYRLFSYFNTVNNSAWAVVIPA